MVLSLGAAIERQDSTNCTESCAWGGRAHACHVFIAWNIFSKGKGILKETNSRTNPANPSMILFLNTNLHDYKLFKYKF